MMVLVWGAVTFQSDAQRLVVGPIERMMDTVTLLAKNPLANTNSNMTEMEGETKSEKYETQLLEKTIEKVSTLMQVGFGAAGAEVIGANMQGEDGSVNTMMDGTVITSIYGFCDIRKFTGKRGPSNFCFFCLCLFTKLLLLLFCFFTRYNGMFAGTSHDLCQFLG
jgi:hypothetical protein